MTDLAEGLEGLVVPPPVPVQLLGGTITIGSTGRIVQVGIPEDITDTEAMEFAAYFLTGFLAEIRARSRPRIVPAHGILLPR